jgi:hypothetical protein
MEVDEVFMAPEGPTVHISHISLASLIGSGMFGSEVMVVDEVTHDPRGATVHISHSAPHPSLRGFVL